MKEMRRVTDEWSRTLIIYDIETDKIRTKVVHILESYGIRVQKSAFECHLNDKKLVALKNQLKKVATEDDSIRIYRIDKTCFDISEFGDVPVYSSKTVIV